MYNVVFFLFSRLSRCCCWSWCCSCVVGDRVSFTRWPALSATSTRTILIGPLSILPLTQSPCLTAYSTRSYTACYQGNIDDMYHHLVLHQYFTQNLRLESLVFVGMTDWLVCPPHAVGRVLAPWSGHTKTNSEIDTHCLLAWPAGVTVVVLDSSLCKKPILCGNVYGDTIIKLLRYSGFLSRFVWLSMP